MISHEINEDTVEEKIAPTKFGKIMSENSISFETVSGAAFPFALAYTFAADEEVHGASTRRVDTITTANSVSRD